jgi:hypothetical protein
MDVSLCARRRGNKILVWETDHLIRAAQALAPRRRKIAEFGLEDLHFFSSYEDANVRSFIDHMARVEAADLDIPIILGADGVILDGMHRLAKAAKSGATSIDVVQFVVEPPPLKIINLSLEDGDCSNEIADVGTLPDHDRITRASEHSSD